MSESTAVECRNTARRALLTLTITRRHLKQRRVKTAGDLAVLAEQLQCIDRQLSDIELSVRELSAGAVNSLGTRIKMPVIPCCDICAARGATQPACADAKLDVGAWAYVCERHFAIYQCRLGTGRGQKLILAR